MRHTRLPSAAAFKRFEIYSAYNRRDRRDGGDMKKKSLRTRRALWRVDLTSRRRRQVGVGLADGVAAELLAQRRQHLGAESIFLAREEADLERQRDHRRGHRQ